MTINYFIYDDVLDTFLEFQKGEEYFLQYYLITHHYRDLNMNNNITCVNQFHILQNKKRKLEYKNKKNKKSKYY